MNPFPYYDPGLEGQGSPSADQAWGDPKSYAGEDTLTAGSTWEGLPKELLKLLAPNLMEGQRPPLESALLDAGNWLPTPERGAMLASKELGPLAAGMIRWGSGKEYPTAKLFRSVETPEEIDWLKKIYQRGDAEERLASIVTPSHLSSYTDTNLSPYGLLWNVNNPKNIKEAYASDAFLKHPEARIGGTHKDITYMPLDSSGWVNPYAESLEKLFARQRQKVQESIEAPPGKSGTILNEIIYNLENPSELSGIRLPFTTDRDITFLKNPKLEESLLKLADDMNLPTYRWPNDWKTFVPREWARKQDQMLEDPLRGSWVPRKGENTYLTSSRLKDFFGIRELP